uniref:Uncharacterized protein n=1 Tax=Arundo donax TaxID=35708 RepID=A0A0A9H9T2_ARUDO
MRRTYRRRRSRGGAPRSPQR